MAKLSKMTESIMSSVEGQCELEIKHAVSLDLFDQYQNNQNKIKRSYFVSITDFFIIITEKSKCIGQLFIPSYTGYEQFQDNVQFNFFFRVRDSEGYDVRLMPPERLRKRFESKLHSIEKTIANMGQQNVEKDTIEFECSLKIKEKVEKVIVHIDHNFINIYGAENHIFLDKIDLSEPNVYVDGFFGFENPPENPTVYIYADGQLRQTLTFDKKQITDSQVFMKTVARSCVKYRDNSNNPLMKGLEIQNSESHIVHTDEKSDSITIKKTSSIGINEFREEPKYTKFPQTMKQKMKKSIKNQIKMHKSLFEQSKKDLKDLRANQKRIQAQQEHNKLAKEKQLQLQQEKEQEKNQSDHEEFLPQSNFFNSTPIDDNDYKGSSNSNSDDDPPYTSNFKPLTYYPAPKADRIQLKKFNSTNFIDKRVHPDIQEQNRPQIPNRFQNQIQNLNDNSNITEEQNSILKSKSQPNVYQINSSSTFPSPKKSQIPLPYKPSVKNYSQSSNQSFLFFPTEEKTTNFQSYNNKMELADMDINRLRIIIKSYLMIDYRNKYFTDDEINKSIQNENDNESQSSSFKLLTGQSLNNNNNNNNSSEKINSKNSPEKKNSRNSPEKNNSKNSPEKKSSKNSPEKLDMESSEELSESHDISLIIDDLKNDLDNQQFNDLINKMMNGKNDVNPWDFINYINNGTQCNEMQKKPLPKDKNGNQLLAELFTTSHQNKRLCDVFNKICKLICEPASKNKNILNDFADTYFLDADVIRELSHEEWDLICKNDNNDHAEIDEDEMISKSNNNENQVITDDEEFTGTFSKLSNDKPENSDNYDNYEKSSNDDNADSGNYSDSANSYNSTNNDENTIEYGNMSTEDDDDDDDDDNDDDDDDE